MYHMHASWTFTGRLRVVLYRPLKNKTHESLIRLDYCYYILDHERNLRKLVGDKKNVISGGRHLIKWRPPDKL